MPAGVLVVDDEEAVAFTLAEILAQEGYEVEQATSVAAALARIERRAFDVALLDLRIGEDSGLSVLAHLKERSPATVAVVLTGFGSLDTAIQALRQGAFDYLLKPCDVEEMKAAIARGLEQRRRAHADAAEAAAAELEQALQRALRARDDFLTIAGHELKTPLSVIIGWAEHLQRQLSRGTTEDAATQLDLMVGRARRMARLVDDFIDVASIQQGALAPRLEPCDLRAVIEVAVRNAREAHANRELRTDLEDAPVPVQADATYLARAVGAVLDNALKFSPGGGPVDVRLTAGDGEARLAVRDQGIGIAAADVARIFDRFHQVDANVLTRRFGGVGIGLYLSRVIVEQHGGRIEAESAGPDQGSTFTIVLPLAAS